MTESFKSHSRASEEAQSDAFKTAPPSLPIPIPTGSSTDPPQLQVGDQSFRSTPRKDCVSIETQPGRRRGTTDDLDQGGTTPTRPAGSPAQRARYCRRGGRPATPVPGHQPG